MNQIIPNDNLIFTSVKEKEITKEIFLFTKEERIGKLFFLKGNSSVASLILDSETWIMEREGVGFETSHIIIDNVKANHSYLVVDLEIGKSNAISVSKKGWSFEFCKTSYRKDKWAWVNVVTGENVIEFETKIDYSVNGRSKINRKFIKTPEIIILCALGWFFLEVNDESLNRKLECMKELTLEDTMLA